MQIAIQHLSLATAAWFTEPKPYLFFFKPYGELVAYIMKKIIQNSDQNALTKYIVLSSRNATPSWFHLRALPLDLESKWWALSFFLRTRVVGPPPSLKGIPMRAKSLWPSLSVLAVVVMQTSIPLGLPRASNLISGNTLCSRIPME